LRPRLGVGKSAKNSQVRFQVNLQVAPLTGMTSPVTSPLVIEAANAGGFVNALTCANPDTASAALIHMITSGVKVTLGTATNLTANAPVVTTPGVLVQSAASAGTPLLNANVFLALGLS